jgi:hypothetical protein
MQQDKGLAMAMLDVMKSETAHLYESSASRIFTFRARSHRAIQES